MVISRTNLSKMKSEIRNQFKISHDISIDAEAAKIVSDAYWYTNELSIKGFIHELSANPFGFLLISDIQVYI